MSKPAESHAESKPLRIADTKVVFGPGESLDEEVVLFFEDIRVGEDGIIELDMPNVSMTHIVCRDCPEDTATTSSMSRDGLHEITVKSHRIRSRSVIEIHCAG